MKYTQDDINQLKKSGKIRGFTNSVKSKKQKLPRKNYKSKGFVSLQNDLREWAKQKGFYLLKELTFDDNRRFRFDFAFLEIKTAIEYEGGVFMAKSGHNTAIHYTKDVEKYNLAVINGWKVLRFTALNYKTVGETLDKLLKNEGA